MKSGEFVWLVWANCIEYVVLEFQDGIGDPEYWVVHRADRHAFGHRSCIYVVHISRIYKNPVEATSMSKYALEPAPWPLPTRVLYVYELQSSNYVFEKYK